MDLQTILRRRAFRDGYHDGKHGVPMRRYLRPRWRYYYALGRIFANTTPDSVRIFEQRQVTPEALAFAIKFLRAA